MAEVFGTDWIEAASDKLVALMEALKTTMVAGYDPTFSYVYTGHTVANLRLNAVTVELQDYEPSEVQGYGAGSLSMMVNVTFTIRVHTDYAGGVMDTVKNSRLLNSIANKLLKNNALGSDYFVRALRDIRARLEFEESATYGGELAVVIEHPILFTQE